MDPQTPPLAGQAFAPRQKAWAAEEVPIVLTATIVPNVRGMTAANPESRLEEYRQMIRFCLPFAPVILLENSTYPLTGQLDFQETDRLQIRRFTPSSQPERGKGYQEFEMIDAWLATETHLPARWLKITGRYRPLNLKTILAECRREKAYSLLIDQVPQLRRARTYLFYTRTEFYRDQLRGLYQRCDDRKGDWIEHVVFRQLEQHPRLPVRFFRTQPRLLAADASSGNAFPSGKFQWFIKQSLRFVNGLVDRRRLWYAR